MKKNNSAKAKTQCVKPSNFIGKTGYYLKTNDGFEGNSDFDSLTIEKGICEGFLDIGAYCINNDGGKATWFPTLYSALQSAQDIVELWDDYGFEKPLKLSLSDEIQKDAIGVNVATHKEVFELFLKSL